MKRKPLSTVLAESFVYYAKAYPNVFPRHAEKLISALKKRYHYLYDQD